MFLNKYLHSCPEEKRSNKAEHSVKQRELYPSKP